MPKRSSGGAGTGATRTSNSKGARRQGRSESSRSGPGASKREKPRTIDHFCKRTSMIRRGDARDCRICQAVSFVSVEMIEEARRAARRQETTLGAGAREMGKYDAAGKPWGYKSAGYFPGIGKGRKS